MPDPTAPDRTPASAARRPRVLERLVVVAAVGALLVAVGAWFAMNRPDGAAEAAAASTSAGTSGGSFSETTGTRAQGTTAPDPAAPAADTPAAGTPAPAPGPGTAGGTSAGTGGSRTTAAKSTTAPRSTSGTAPLSPTTDFLNQLTASGLGPPVDDAAKLSMADDVCQELKNGSTYVDVVRALTFSGASDEQAANFARLAVTNLCPKFPVG